MEDLALRRELSELLTGENAHMGIEEAVRDFPVEYINRKPPHSPYSFWHFLEHIRIAQWDILEFIRNPDHVSPVYPEGYRPRPHQTTDEIGWRRSEAAIVDDLGALLAIVEDPATILTAPIPHAPGYTILREVLVAADHNAYHIGELAILRQVMNIWPVTRPYLTGTDN